MGTFDLLPMLGPEEDSTIGLEQLFALRRPTGKASFYARGAIVSPKRAATTPPPARAPEPAQVVLLADPEEESRREQRERDFQKLQADLKGIRTNRVRTQQQMVNFVRCGGGVLWSGLPKEAMKGADPQVTRQAAALVASLRL